MGTGRFTWNTRDGRGSPARGLTPRSLTSGAPAPTNASLVSIRRAAFGDGRQGRAQSTGPHGLEASPPGLVTVAPQLWTSWALQVAVHALVLARSISGGRLQRAQCRHSTPAARDRVDSRRHCSPRTRKTNTRAGLRAMILGGVTLPEPARGHRGDSVRLRRRRPARRAIVMDGEDPALPDIDPDDHPGDLRSNGGGGHPPTFHVEQPLHHAHPPRATQLPATSGRPEALCAPQSPETGPGCRPGRPWLSWGAQGQSVVPPDAIGVSPERSVRAAAPFSQRSRPQSATSLIPSSARIRFRSSPLAKSIVTELFRAPTAIFTRVFKRSPMRSARSLKCA